MPPIRIYRIIIVLAAAVILWLPQAPSLTAQEAPPVITTPTPAAASPRAEWLSIPEQERANRLLFLPMLARPAGRVYSDVRSESYLHVVQPGETLWSLALDSGRDLDTMACSTRPLGPDAESLTPGETITIPALNDLCYTVRPGDTLPGVAKAHGMKVDDIAGLAWNGFTSPPYSIQPRQRILLPGVRPDAAPRRDRATVSRPADAWASSPWPEWPFGDGQFVWPVRGPISQYWRPGHRALDIAIPERTPVLAADRGTVTMAGWNPTGYGFRVVIDHGNDYVTLYAHLSDIYVEPGQIVGKEQVIGSSGANGNITGPHLHFELRDFGILIDPLALLPN